MATIYEEVKVQAKDLVDKVQDFIHEGNVRRIIIKDERGHTFLEIPLTIAAIGVVALRCWPPSRHCGAGC